MNPPASPSARVVQINISPHGGVPKHRVASAKVTLTGIIGDMQKDQRYHGGPDRAVTLFSYERIVALQAEGHPIAPGTTGENLTISGLDWERLQPGDCLHIGDRLCLEITDYAAPCSTIVDSFKDGVFKRISQKTHPGWSRLCARVLVEGTVSEDDTVDYDEAV